MERLIRRAFLVDERRRGRLQRQLADVLPEAQQIFEVALDLGLGAAGAGGAQDDAHALRHFEVGDDLLQPLAVGGDGDLARDAAAAGGVGHQHRIAAGEREIGGERRALVAALFLDDLDQQHLPALDDFLDLVLAGRARLRRSGSSSSASSAPTDSTWSSLTTSTSSCRGRSPCTAGCRRSSASWLRCLGRASLGRRLSSGSLDFGGVTSDRSGGECSAVAGVARRWRSLPTAVRRLGSPASAAASSARRRPRLGVLVVLVALAGACLGFGDLALLGLDQRLPVGDRDLVVVGMDFREGEEAVAVAAVVDEGRLQRRLDPGDLG